MDSSEDEFDITFNDDDPTAKKTVEAVEESTVTKKEPARMPNSDAMTAAAINGEFALGGGC